MKWRTAAMTATTSDSRAKSLGDAFVETIRGSRDFQDFCARIHQRDRIVVSVACDVFMLSRDGLVPLRLTPAKEAEWLSKMGRVA
jgi:hypothetical protein